MRKLVCLVGCKESQKLGAEMLSPRVWEKQWHGKVSTIVKPGGNPTQMG